MLHTLDSRHRRCILLLLYLFSTVIAGITVSVHSTPASATVVTRLPVPHHRDDWTSATYYARFHPQKMTQHPRPKKSPSPLPGKPGQAGTIPGFNIWFNNLPSSSTVVDASNGVPLTLCVTQVSSTMNGSAAGQNVYLTSANGGAFAPSVAVIDQTGCVSVTYYAPQTGLNTVNAAINYITPDFNAYDNGQAISTYTSFPYVSSAQINVGVRSVLPTDVFVPQTGLPNIGEKAYTAVDASLPLIGGSISLARTYNSARLVDSPFGLGWNSLLSQSISFIPSPITSIVDDLNDWSQTSSHTANLAFDTSNSSTFFNDTSRVMSTVQDNEAVIWKTNNLSWFQATAYFYFTSKQQTMVSSSLLFYTSSDGSTWSNVSPTVKITGNPTTSNPPFAVRATYTLQTSTMNNYVKVVWNNPSSTAAPVELGQMKMTSGSPCLQLRRGCRAGFPGQLR